MPYRRVLVTLVVAGAALLTSPAAFAQDNLNCGDFTYQDEAQAVLEDDPADPNDLDRDDDGRACESLPSRGEQDGGQTSEQPDPTTTTTQPQAPVAAHDQDRDCPDFASQEAAQAVLEQHASDPNRLDRDGDGIACERATPAQQQVERKPVGGVATGGHPGQNPATGVLAGSAGLLVLIGVAACGGLALRRRARR